MRTRLLFFIIALSLSLINSVSTQKVLVSEGKISVVDSTECTTDSSFTLSNALKEANTKPGEVILNVEGDTNVEGNISFNGSKSDSCPATVNFYVVQKLIIIQENISFSMDGGSFMAELPLTISNLDIFITLEPLQVDDSDVAIIIQKLGTLTVSGNQDSFVTFGMADSGNEVDLKKPLILIESGASVSLSYVNIQNVKSAEETNVVNCLGLSMTLGESSGSISLSDVKFVSLYTEGSAAAMSLNYASQTTFSLGTFTNVVIEDSCTITGERKVKKLYLEYSDSQI